MSKGSPPAAPDPVQTANAQTASNKQTALTNAALNRINQYTPFGTSTYDVNGTDANGIPIYSQTVNLSPEQQRLYDMSVQGQQALGETALQSLSNVRDTYAKPFDPGDFGASIKQAQDAAYNAQTQYLDPQFAQEGNTLDAKLANYGLQTGDKAYDNAQQMFGLGKQQAYQSARNAAISAGNQEQQNLFGQALTRYNLPLNTYNALATGSQVSQPTFGNIPGVSQANTDVAGITNAGYQNQLARYNASQSGLNNLFSLGGSLGAAALLA